MACSRARISQIIRSCNDIKIIHFSPKSDVGYRISVLLESVGCSLSYRQNTVQTFLRYLFNAGEGSQRLAQELKLKLRRVRNIFITHESWDNLSGLPGVAMALRDMGVTHVDIYGPSAVVSILSSK